MPDNAPPVHSWKLPWKRRLGALARVLLPTRWQKALRASRDRRGFIRRLCLESGHAAGALPADGAARPGAFGSFGARLAARVRLGWLAIRGQPRRADAIRLALWEKTRHPRAGWELVLAQAAAGDGAGAAWAGQSIVRAWPDAAYLLGDYWLSVKADPDAARAIYQLGLDARPADAALRLKIVLMTPPVEDSAESLRLRRAALPARARELAGQLRRERSAGAAGEGDPARAGPDFVYGCVMYPTQCLMWRAEDDREIMRAAAEAFLAAFPDLAWRADADRPAAAPPRQGPFRLGMISDSRDGRTLAACWGPVLAALRDVGSPPSLYVRTDFEPRHGAALARLVDAIRVYPPGDWRAARGLIADDRLDILYNPQAGQEMVATLLGFSRLAPVQIMDAGYTSTSGLPEMDWFAATEAFLPPDADRRFTERLLRLPGLPPLFVPPPPANVQASARRDWGLPENKRLYACIQDPRKLHPEFDLILADILDRDPDGALMLSRSGIPEVDRRVRLRLAAALPIDRVHWIPHLEGAKSRYYGMLRLQDAGLAAWRFCGGTTFGDHNALGLPLVTLEAPDYSGRYAAGTYRMLGLEELIAPTPRRYAEIAVQLANDAAFRQSMRHRLAAALAAWRRRWRNQDAGTTVLVAALADLARQSRESGDG